MPTMKKVSFWATLRVDRVFSGFRCCTEMFGELFRLQTVMFFSIGHSFAALAFVVSGVGNLPERTVPQLAAGHACSSDLLVRTA